MRSFVDAGPTGALPPSEAPRRQRPQATPAPEAARADDDRSIAAVVARLVEDFPEVPHELVDGLFRAAHADTADARVQDFRIVLAERSTRAELRRRRSPG